MVSLALLEGCQTYRPPAPTPGQLAQQQPRRPVRAVRPPAARNAQEPPAAAEAPGGEAPTGDPPEAPAAGLQGAMPEQTAAASPPLPAAPPAPQRITGWRADEVRQRFGQPASQRTAGAARVWRYLGANCAVDVFFYYDTRQATFVALDQRLDGQAASPEACLATVGQPARAG